MKDKEQNIYDKLKIAFERVEDEPDAIVLGEGVKQCIHEDDKGFYLEWIKDDGNIIRFDVEIVCQK